MPAEIKVERHKVFAIMTTVLAYLCWILAYSECEIRGSATAEQVTAVSVAGTLIVIIYILIWKKMTGRLFTPYIVFLAFFTAFNFGQCLLWAVGIHTDQEMGEKLVYSTLDADYHVILKSQLIFIICYITLNCGAMLMWSNKRTTQIQPIRRSDTGNDPRYQYLFYASLVLSLAAIPISLYNAFYKFRLTQIYGYSSLYNGEANALVQNTAMNILSTLFFPCLLGLLIGSRFHKWVRRVVYGVFAVFAGITLLGGDRGEWINMFVFLFWAEYYLYKKRSGKVLALVAVVGILSLSIMNAIVSMRNTGLSWEGFMTALTAEDANPIVSLLTEFGQSMGISILLLAYQVECPYGNTYLMSIPTIFGTGLGNKLLGTSYVQLHTWFPDYLGISYGTDFSIIAEAMLNCGVYLAPLMLLVMGMIIAKVSQLPFRRNIGPLGLCLSLSVMVHIIKIARSTFWLVLNGMVYTVLVFCGMYLVMKLLLDSSMRLRK